MPVAQTRTAPRSRQISLQSIKAVALACLIFGGCGTGLVQAAPKTATPTDQARAKTVEVHRVVILVDSDDDKVMRHAISYTFNLARYFGSKNEKFAIEIVANGSGIKLFRSDTSPLKQPLAALRAMVPEVTFSVCNSSMIIAEQKEGHSISTIDGARLVPFGIGRVIELQEEGWVYVNA